MRTDRVARVRAGFGRAALGLDTSISSFVTARLAQCYCKRARPTRTDIVGRAWAHSAPKLVFTPAGDSLYWRASGGIHFGLLGLRFEGGIFGFGAGLRLRRLVGGSRCGRG